MAAVLQTMFVPPPSPSIFPNSPKTLPPVQTLEQSTSCSSYADVGETYPPRATRETSTSSSGWSPSHLLYPFQLGTILGWRKPAEDVERCYADSQSSYSPSRSSVESLRESLTGHACSLPPISPCHLETKPATYSLPLNSHARSRGPFKPQRASKGTSSWQLRQFAEATLGSGSLRKAVKLPEGEDLNEWLAVNVVDFYNQINLLYGSITEFCSPQTCPEMKATDEYEYLWQDSESFKRPTKMPAPEYIEHLMAWCQNNIDNEQLFPSRIGIQFPKTFPALVRQMFKRLYRVYAHIYCHHYPVIVQLGLEPHLNTSFKHYVLFVDEHSLASGKDFWGPLGELVENMLRSD